MSVESTCPACRGSELSTVVALGDLPVFCNVLADSAPEARDAPMGSIDLRQCTNCAMLVNVAFDEDVAEYQPGYENSLHHSEVFQDWARSLAVGLVERHGLRGRTALEIGCGGGGFLELLCEAGMGRAIGYDPSLPAEAEVSHDERIEIHRGFLEDPPSERIDLALCRHVLEHVTDPGAIVDLLTRAAPEGAIYLEVPDATTMLTTGGIYDVIYEHCSYFGAPAMTALLDRTGLSAIDIRREFGDQYLTVQALPGTESTLTRDADSVSELLELGRQFGRQVSTALAAWAARLEEFRDTGRDVVVWGAGSKGVTFVNLVDGGEHVSRLVDLNPLKFGRFVPGAATAVVAPSDLVADPPDVVVVMNQLYRDEIVAALEELGISAEVVVA